MASITYKIQLNYTRSWPLINLQPSKYLFGKSVSYARAIYLRWLCHFVIQPFLMFKIGME